MESCQIDFTLVFVIRCIDLLKWNSIKEKPRVGVPSGFFEVFEQKVNFTKVSITLVM